MDNNIDCCELDLMAFRTQKQWYLKTGIPYRRGYLLHGPPGTGNYYYWFYYVI